MNVTYREVFLFLVCGLLAVSLSITATLWRLERKEPQVLRVEQIPVKCECGFDIAAGHVTQVLAKPDPAEARR